MFIAMNRFRITPGHEEVFEQIWRERDSRLSGVAGFREFHLLRGATTDECTLFASHVVWDDRASFVAWTESDAFKQAHGKSRAPKGTYLGHPDFEGFEVIM